ncbi:MAG: four helix bundle protein, partial [Muribaculaceae bacterium]|nr:four helix bundle protein [Muribaculaceae bacterium]
MADSYSFEKLAAYMEAKDLVKHVYRLTKSFPDDEKYCLTSQIKRAVISIASNIAEGSSRISIKEKIHFLEISYGSLMETYCQISISRDLGYISSNEFSFIKQKFFHTSA